jgi:hypothetical protein
MIESPLEPEAYVNVAGLAFQKKDPVGQLYWARQALNCSDENRSHASDPACYGDLPADFAYSAAYELGLMIEALAHAREAARRNPESQRHADNVAALERMVVEEGPKP